MKLDFDISAQEYSIIRDILEAHLPKGVAVWVFGSRAKNTARFNSDLDLALEGTEALPKDVIPRLKDAFTDAPIAYRVDLVDMAEVSNSFAEVIRAQAVRFPIEPQGNVPKLRFPGFREPLSNVKLGEVASFSKGKGISKNDIAPDGALPCIRYGELYTVYDTIIDEPVSRTDAPTSTLTLSKGDEVLVPASGEDAKDIATAAVVKRPGVALGGDLNIIRSENDGAFLASYLSGRKRMTLAAMAQGNSVVHLYPAQLKNLDVHLPTLSEQRKIASFLGAVDTKITQLAEKKRLLEDYKKGCMQQLFSQEIRFKDDDGKDFPDWEEKQLGKVASVYQPETLSQSQLNDEGEFLVYGANGVIGRLDRYNHENAQVAITCRGNTCGRVTFTKPKSWITGNAMVVNLDDAPDISKRFVFNLFLHTDWTYLITGSGQPQITGDIKKHRIKLPHPAEQRKIADFLSALDRKIDLVGAELEHAKTFKKGLLQQMFV